MALVKKKTRTSSGEQELSAQEEEIPPHETWETEWSYDSEHPLQVWKSEHYLIFHLRVVHKGLSHLQTGRCSTVP